MSSMTAVACQSPRSIFMVTTMSETKPDVKVWIEKVKKSRSREAILALVEEFRPLSWTDDERATMAKCYIRQIGLTGDTISDAAVVDSKDDGPVWYEKM